MQQSCSLHTPHDGTTSNIRLHHPKPFSGEPNCSVSLGVTLLSRHRAHYPINHPISLIKHQGERGLLGASLRPSAPLHRFRSTSFMRSRCFYKLFYWLDSVFTHDSRNAGRLIKSSLSPDERPMATTDSLLSKTNFLSLSSQIEEEWRGFSTLACTSSLTVSVYQLKLSIILSLSCAFARCSDSPV